MLRGVQDVRAGRDFIPPESFIDAFGRVLASAPRDPAFAAEALTLPSESYIASLRRWRASRRPKS